MTGRAYYNDTDPFVCDWLRNLIRLGHITQGEVDERSIKEVSPKDLKGFERVHFFAGIAGWDLALTLAGWDGPVWTGSCPCQPLSSAGRRQGHADQRHLWPAFYRLIAECRPATVFGEQVASKDGREWLAAVRLDLESLDYACGCADLPAASAGEKGTCIDDDATCLTCGYHWDSCQCNLPGPFSGAEDILGGAPHIRQRLWWVANTNQRRREKGRLPVRRQKAVVEQGPIRNVAEPKVQRREWSQAAGREAGHGPERSGGGSVGDPAIDRQERQPRNGESEASQEPERPARGSSDGRSDGAFGDTDGQGPSFGETISGEPEIQGTGRPGYDAWIPVRYTQCADGKARPIKPGLEPLAHGIPGRVGRLRAYGNTITPQVAAVFITSFMECQP